MDAAYSVFCLLRHAATVARVLIDVAMGPKATGVLGKNYFPTPCAGNPLSVQYKPLREGGVKRWGYTLDACLLPNSGERPFFPRDLTHPGYFATFCWSLALGKCEIISGYHKISMGGYCFEEAVNCSCSGCLGC